MAGNKRSKKRESSVEELETISEEEKNNFRELMEKILYSLQADEQDVSDKEKD